MRIRRASGLGRVRSLFDPFLTLLPMPVSFYRPGGVRAARFNNATHYVIYTIKGYNYKKRTLDSTNYNAGVTRIWRQGTKAHSGYRPGEEGSSAQASRNNKEARDAQAGPAPNIRGNSR